MASLLMNAIGAVSRIEVLQPWLNRIAINIANGTCPARPQPYSLWTPNKDIPVLDEAYPTWPGLVDRRYTGRHLPPAAPRAVLPEAQRVVELFMRPNADGQDRTTPSSRTSTLFCFFAQWFTDSFLRTDRSDTRLNTSNHDIDLCEIYGLTAETAALLRQRRGGRMLVEARPTGEFPPRLFDAAGEVRAEFAALPYAGFAKGILDGTDLKTLLSPEALTARTRALYATGLDRGSNTILYAGFNALFLREHNRIAGVLAAAHPAWDDDRLFETARNVNIVQGLKLVIEEYIHHIAASPIRFRLDRTFAEGQRWYRANRITIEFDLLYRWHPMIPNALTVDGRVIDANEYRWNNALLEELGIEALFAAASRQAAGRIQLRNTPRFMQGAEVAGLLFARKHRVQPFNAYRRYFNLTPYASHEALTGDAVSAAELAVLYPDVDDVEFQVGLFAESHDDGSSFGELLRTMVAVDAFSQVFTNPLLAGEVYDAALGAAGDRIVQETTCLQDVVARNAVPGAPVLARFNLG